MQTDGTLPPSYKEKGVTVAQKSRESPHHMLSFVQDKAISQRSHIEKCVVPCHVQVKLIKHKLHWLEVKANNDVLREAKDHYATSKQVKSGVRVRQWSLPLEQHLLEEEWWQVSGCNVLVVVVDVATELNCLPNACLMPCCPMPCPMPANACPMPANAQCRCSMPAQFRCPMPANACPMPYVACCCAA
eukprot:1143298-Pelagomonas_calceolata.AAC.5